MGRECARFSVSLVRSGAPLLPAGQLQRRRSPVAGPVGPVRRGAMAVAPACFLPSAVPCPPSLLLFNSLVSVDVVPTEGGVRRSLARSLVPFCLSTVFVKFILKSSCIWT